VAAALLPVADFPGVNAKSIVPALDISRLPYSKPLQLLPFSE